MDEFLNSFKKGRFICWLAFEIMSYPLLINNSHIYIYIYRERERERERERDTHMLWWLPNDVQYILFKHTTYIMY